MPARSAAQDLADDASDPDVIAAVVAGDTARFAVLVRRHNQAVFRACRAVIGDDTEAEDAVQSAWVQAYRALATFRGESTFRTWVTRIAVHEASHRLQARRRLAAVPIEEVMTMPAAVDPEGEAATEQLGRLLERHIDQLPEGMRVVLVLRDIMELDTAETASCLGIAEEAVRVRLHRARQALATTLLDSAGDLSPPTVWRFDGERCSRTVARVMAAIIPAPPATETT
jgi:RNA polymerase sigma-70 factor (ECF subfamily)